MGSKDTGEVYTPRFEGGQPRMPVRTPQTSIDDQVDPRPAPEASYDRGLKTIVSLGGGLTPDRIVYPVPEDVRDGSLQQMVDYLVNPHVATRTEDRAIVEAVQNRMQRPGYRMILNHTMNVGSDQLTNPAGGYLRERELDGEDGPMKFNALDIAIVSQDEGGRYHF